MLPDRSRSIAWAAALALACSPTSETSPDSDGAKETDAASPDVSVGGQGGGVTTDASADRPPDEAGGGAAAAPTDGGPPADAGPPWWDDSRTSWTPLPWAPECPSFAYASDPGAVAPPLVWEPCTGGLPGCRMFLPAAPPGQKIGITIDAARDGQGYRFALFILPQVQTPTVRAVIYEANGTPSLALKGVFDTAGCAPNGVRVSPSVTCFAVGKSSDPASHVCGSVEDIKTATSPTAVMPRSQGAVLTDEILALWLSTGLDIATLNVASGLVSQPAAGGTFFEPRASGPFALARVSFGPDRKEGFLWNEPSLVSLVKPSNAVLLDINTDGSSLAWIQAEPKTEPMAPFYGNAELWIAPFTTDPSSLTGTKIRDVPDAPDWLYSVAGEGYYAVQKEATATDIYRLSDGRHFRAQFPGDFRIGLYPPPWVDSEELITPTTQFGTKQIGVIRQRLTDLGPGD